MIQSQHRERGFTLTEILVTVAIFIIFALGVYQGYLAVYNTISLARLKSLAVDLANAQFEIVKNLPYTSVGIVGGNPAGVLSATESVVRDNVSFTIARTIENVDDPFDGVSGGGDQFPNDYKLVEISIDCDTCKNFIPIVITGRIAPKNLESAFNSFINLFIG